MTESKSDPPASHARPSWSIPRMLRSLTGVDEEILSRIPTERARYTAMGGVVLGTALIAMVSMAAAISFVLNGFPWFAAMFVLIWGLFIISMDRWLMSATTTVDPLRRAIRLLPRLLLAVAVGTVVAEPLVLMTFGSEITEQADRERKAELLELESKLLACNPVPGTDEERNSPVRTPACGDFRLALSGSSAEGQQARIAALETQANTLEATIKEDSAAYATLEAEARKECNGTDGPGLSGEKGEGPNCRRLRGKVDEYRSDHRIDENNKELARLRSEIERLTGQLGANSDAFAAARREAIDARIDEAEERQKGLGLLERMRTLGHLTDENGYALAGEWALRIFLILIDALPVLVKFLSGFTTYDEIVADRLVREKEGEIAVNKVRGNMRTVSARLWQLSHEEQARVVERRIRSDSIQQVMTIDATVQAKVNDRYEQLVREAPTVAFALPERPATTIEPEKPDQPEAPRMPPQRDNRGWADRPTTFGDDRGPNDRMPRR